MHSMEQIREAGVIKHLFLKHGKKQKLKKISFFNFFFSFYPGFTSQDSSYIYGN